MMWATGWVAALIPVIVLSFIVVVAYIAWGKGPVRYRRIAGGSYLAILSSLILCLFGAASRGADSIALALLIPITVIAALGLAWPWLAKRHLRVRETAHQ